MFYRKLLFYYSVIISSALFVWVIIFLPKPESIIPLALFLPIVLHFWLGIVWPNKITSLLKGEGEIKKSQIFGFSMTVFVSIVVATTSILLYSFAYERYSPVINSLNKIKEDEANMKLILEKLDSIENESMNFKSKIDKVYDEVVFGQNLKITDEKIIKTLEEKSPSASSEGILKVTKNSDVYSDTNIKAKVVGIAQAGNIYNFTQKIKGWYLIILPDFTEGWIEQGFVTEL